MKSAHSRLSTVGHLCSTEKTDLCSLAHGSYLSSPQIFSLLLTFRLFKCKPSSSPCFPAPYVALSFEVLSDLLRDGAQITDNVDTAS